jgi:hypothetical protein
LQQSQSEKKHDIRRPFSSPSCQGSSGSSGGKCETQSKEEEDEETLTQ